MPKMGHWADVYQLEHWTVALAQFGPKEFYAQVNPAAYQQGYALILWGTAVLGSAFGWLSGEALLYLVKLPAVLADLGIAYLTFLIVRHTWNPTAAMVAAAIAVFNPAVWFVSAYWGQVDSVAALLLVWAIYLAITDRFEFAWAASALGVLVKPHAIATAPLLLLWQIRRQGITWRMLAIPPIGALVAYLGTAPFAPTYEPAGVLAWLLKQLAHGRDNYPFNSVNAFNLYSTTSDFYQNDGLTVVGIPLWAWGIAIFACFAGALAFRLWQTTGPKAATPAAQQSLYMASFLLMFGYFVLLTRMHERYLFSAIALAPLIWNTGALQRVVVVLLSVSYVVNLEYALAILNHPSNDLNPLLVHTFSAINVVCLAVITGAYVSDAGGAAIDRFFARMRRIGALESRPAPVPAPGGEVMPADDDAAIAAFERYLRAFVEGRTIGSPVHAHIAHHFGYSEDGTARRGKRLRPRLALAAAASFGAPRDIVFPACAAIELLHNYSLIHDDIEDGDRVRHGRETLWSRYGEAQGINAGDFVGALAHLALEPVATTQGAQIAHEMARELAAANVAMCEGQARDLALEGGADASLAAYLEMIRGKTAALFGCAAALGALSARCDKAAVERCERIGVLYGTGFQILDDMLGIWGAQEQTGKTERGDIARKKKTYPIVWALDNDPHCAGDAIAQAYGKGHGLLEDADIERVRQALERCGAREATATAAASYFEQALQCAQDYEPLQRFVRTWSQPTP